MSNLTLVTALLASSLSLAACTTSDATSSLDRAIIQTPCAADTDCPSGFECEIEVEHGVTTSFCQASEDSDGTCPAGYEREVEHGQAFCQPHGGGGGGGGSDDDTGSTGTGVVGAACVTSADCTVGLECEVEVHNGQTTSTCQAHGGH